MKKAEEYYWEIIQWGGGRSEEVMLQPIRFQCLVVQQCLLVFKYFVTVV
jgi:hypothetical protein